jgi:hypothetical protein
MNKKQCDGCRFCCWSFAVNAVPSPFNILQSKKTLNHCPQECEVGCAIWTTSIPAQCKNFHCPYIYGNDIHRPDAFQELLEKLAGNVGNYIPFVPSGVSVEETKALVLKTRTIPAAITMPNGGWKVLVMPLDREPDGTWYTNKSRAKNWVMLFNKHGYHLPTIEFRGNKENGL